MKYCLVEIERIFGTHNLTMRGFSRITGLNSRSMFEYMHGYKKGIGFEELLIDKVLDLIQELNIVRPKRTAPNGITDPVWEKWYDDVASKIDITSLRKECIAMSKILHILNYDPSNPTYMNPSYGTQYVGFVEDVGNALPSYSKDKYIKRYSK